MVKIKPGKYNAGDVSLEVSVTEEGTAVAVRLPDRKTYCWTFSEEGVFSKLSVHASGGEPPLAVMNSGTVMACPHIDRGYKGKIFVSSSKSMPLTKAACPNCCDYRVRLPEGRLNLLTSEVWKEIVSRCEVVPVEE